MKSLSTLFLEQSEPALEPRISKFFKFLNDEKKKHKTRAALLDVIKNVSPYMGIPKNHELYLLELYLLNYRKDGDYSSITKKNFVDPRHMKGKWTPNTLSDRYTVTQLPFRGSNLEGYWTKDIKGNAYYVVNSFGWFPIYIFKDGIWYESTKRYSNATGRQMRNSNPVEWNDDLSSNVYLLTQEEMKMLQKGSSHDEILKHKLKKIKDNEPELISKRLTLTRPYMWRDENSTPVVIKFKIRSVDVEGDKATVNVDIYDVLKKDRGGSGLPTPENYLKGELRGIDKNYVESKISSKIKSNFRDYIGPRYNYIDPLEDRHLVKFNFNHLRK